MKKFNSKGVGAVPLIVVILLVGLLVLAGLRINKTRNNSSKKAENNVSQVVAPISTAKDVESVSKDLDTVNIDNELDTADLETDISSVL